ncbi:MAG: FN3 domain-containing metallophosphoesterase family protein [Peptoniphilaceae bacterium]|nr:FN3 domain-containing metallophosphoesterase family protein [Peptoniphilaceae bacterium]MDY6019475.1 FN3 domain-containing metallophosphoesterase family protein [Anaerococcus sp.]
MKKNNKLVFLLVLANISIMAMPKNSLAASSYDDILENSYEEKTTTDQSNQEDFSEENKELSDFYLDDENLTFQKNESKERTDDGTDKFNRSTETKRETFGQDKNVNNIEKEVKEKLDLTKGQYGKKEGPYGQNNLKENTDPIKDIVVNQGANENQIAITWFGKAPYQDSKVVFDGKTYKAYGSKTGDNQGYYSYRALIDGIVPGNTYSYYVQTGNNKSPIYNLKTKAFGKDKSFSVAWFGDPQIGSGDSVWDSKGLEKHSQGKVEQDKADFAKIIKKAREENPNFFISMGDNVEVATYEGEYDAFLDNDLFREAIFTSVIGNHETYTDENDPIDQNTVFKDHFYQPNEAKQGSIVGLTKQGKPIYLPGDFYYTYGDSLFLNLNSNEEDSAIHEEFIKNAIKEATSKRGSNFSWIVVSFHHSPYSTATHTADDDIIQRRKEMVKIFNDNKIDLVLNGHDHIYARTYPMLAGETAMSFKEAFGTDINNPKAQVKDGYSKTYNTKIYGKDMVIVDGIPVKYDGNKITNPRGTIFLTMSDSTGSKFYNPISEDSWYAAKSLDDRSQLFAKLIFSKHQFQLVTKDVSGEIKDMFTITKTEDAIKNGINYVEANNKEKLKKAIDKAKSLSKDVVFDDMEAYLDSIQEAEKVLQDKTLSQETVDSAIDALKTRLSANSLLKSEAKEEKKISKKENKKEIQQKEYKAPSKNSNPKTGLEGIEGILFLLV